MFSALSGSIWMDGEIMPWAQARCHVMTHALHYGSSVYEGLRTYGGKIFKGREHYDRLHHSAGFLAFKIPYSVEELLRATQDLLEKEGYKEGYVRAISWCGSKTMKVSSRGADVHTAIGIWERPLSYSEEILSQGIRMNIANWRRPHPQTAPVHSKAAGLYMISSLSKKASEESGFDDALMLDYQGNVAEATSSNIFLVVDGALWTPLPTCFLNGITRLTCLEIAEELGIHVNESALSLEDFSRAQEVFLTGTAIEILPVGSLEGGGRSWHFTPGRVTQSIRSAYKKKTTFC